MDDGNATVVLVGGALALFVAVAVLCFGSLKYYGIQRKCLFQAIRHLPFAVYCRSSDCCFDASKESVCETLSHDSTDPNDLVVDGNSSSSSSFEDDDDAIINDESDDLESN